MRVKLVIFTIISLFITTLLFSFESKAIADEAPATAVPEAAKFPGMQNIADDDDDSDNSSADESSSDQGASSDSNDSNNSSSDNNSSDDSSGDDDSSE